MLDTNVAIPEFVTTSRAFSRTPTAYRRIGIVAMILCDTLMVFLAFGAAHQLRFYGGITVAPDVPVDTAKYVMWTVLLFPIWISVFWFMRLYDYHYLLSGTVEYTRAMNASTLSMMLVVLISFLQPNIQIARAWLIMAWLLSSLFVSVGRFALRRVAYQMRDRGYFVSPAIIVGVNQEALALANQLRDRRYSGLAVLGFVDATREDEPSNGRRAYGGFPIVGNVSSLTEIVSTYGVQEVIIAGTALTDAQRIEVLERLINQPGIELRLSSGLYEILTTGMQVTTRNSVPLITLNRLRLGRVELGLKTLMDVSLILLCLPVLLPLFLVISILIKLDSPGPIFYRRRVLGVRDQGFDALKFRTMAVDGDKLLAQRPDLLAELKETHKLKNDPRITRIGRFLRKTSLDELPQLLNVLRGQMSLVGPRMITREEAEMYGTMHLNLLTVKPGLTGLWQVSGRSDLSYDERVRLDIHYIRNYSIWLDLQILLVQTPPAVLNKRGAY